MTVDPIVRLLAAACALLASGVGCAPGGSAPPEESAVLEETAESFVRGERHKHSDRFSNITLLTHHGDRVEFYEDLIKDKVVLINFMYTTCPKICPGTTAQLARINDSFGPWIGDDITMLSISIDPEVDDPERLKRYWEVFGSKPGWLFLTGDYDEIERLRRQLGAYDLDPVIDADKTQHAGTVTFGNDRTDRWSALPVFMHRRQLAKTVLDTTWDGQWKTSVRRMRSPAPVPRVFLGHGEVRQIFPQRGEILIEHDDIPGLMMAMTMLFELKDRSQLDGLRVGQEVDFELELLDEVHRIASIVARASPTAARMDAAPARAGSVF